MQDQFLDKKNYKVPFIFDVTGSGKLSLYKIVNNIFGYLQEAEYVPYLVKYARIISDKDGGKSYVVYSDKPDGQSSVHELQMPMDSYALNGWLWTWLVGNHGENYPIRPDSTDCIKGWRLVTNSSFVTEEKLEKIIFVLKPIWLEIKK